jgi:teichuronic acid biosynthesis glycosyltransferase TuaC
MQTRNSTYSAKVLFVCSGNRSDTCTAAIVNQAFALEKRGVKIVFFRVVGKGILGYLKSCLELKRHLSHNSYYVVHAHYGLSGVVASLAGAHPLVVSLMGSDVLGSGWLRWLVKFFVAFVWRTVMVKSEAMAIEVGFHRVMVVPNGIDFDLFREISTTEAKEKVGFRAPKNILWPANPAREVKNYKLAVDSMEMLKRSDCVLQMVYGEKPEAMPFYYNAADVVLITSHWEGSPNVLKEALACNVPVVSTPVGDVDKWLTNTAGCKICAPNAKDIAGGIEFALAFGKRTNGREQIEELDNENVIKRILEIYRDRIQA